MTKYPTYTEDSRLDSAFERYTKRHYDSWVAFARSKEYGDDVKPVLVSGVDLTRNFAMVAYSFGGASLDSDLTIAIPMPTSASASLWGTWRSRSSPYTNYGPEEYAPPPPEQAMYISSSQLAEGGTPSAFDQCVFIRYYTMRLRGPLGLFPKVIRVGRVSYDLGQGDSAGGTLPDLAVQVMQSDPEPAEDIGVEPDTATRNMPDVWFPVTVLCCIRSESILRMMNTTVGAPLQVTY